MGSRAPGKGWHLITGYRESRPTHSAEVLAQMSFWLRRDLDVYRSDYGRNHGWFVESDGRYVASLVDAIWNSDDQFWHRYSVVPISPRPEDLAAISSEEFWYRPGIVYVNQKYGTRVTDAVAGPKWQLAG